ncbi:uncharacterized protein EDB91DRAFT_191808 [Suillus paluster]|uniref:uncharacterized protein n=1 Tax=Suillus paluster TaxID=48578 RepID=UPI001B87564C|nr:uncharacterized protein EDB91DRAFT_191808 [Suillus paluster]KAG1744586.1 hypothetical protein EDB91DRAFT_191808 [Suillus paluster]
MTVLQHSVFPALKRFEMAVVALPWTEAEQLFRALSQCKAWQTLEHISMVVYDPGVQEPSDFFLAAVTQFAGFTQLRSLHLFLRHSIFLDNDLLLEEMSSWLHVRSLTIEASHCHSPTVTSRRLFAGLRRCPFPLFDRFLGDITWVPVGAAT